MARIKAATGAGAGTRQVLYAELAASADLPDLLELHRRWPGQFPFLLQSVAGDAGPGRWDILFALPGERLTGEAGFSRLSQALGDEPQIDADPTLPFLGGWFFLLGYEAARFIEPTLRIPHSPFRLPDFLAVRCRGAILRERGGGRAWVVSEEGAGLLDHVSELIQNVDSNTIDTSSMLLDEVLEDDPQRFLSGVAKILDYLRAGDAFQVNLSRGWQARLRSGVDHVQVYAGLRRSNPAPFAGLALIDGVAVLSSSPERLVRIEGDSVQTSPIAGTRPRGLGADDERLSRQLIGNLKERAEHVMLIDLERNDLGRVCRPGTVEVSALMRVESHAHVHHIVSDVRGRLRPGIGPAEVLRAVFPGGTITGCPKVRAMQIIAELEGVGRGPYTGAMGYFSRCGRMDSSILIRSLVLQDGVARFRCGAGIVADSLPQAELAETRDKARGLLLALGAAA